MKINSFSTYLLLIFVLLQYSCKSSTKETIEETKEVPATPAATTLPYPQLSNEEITQLYAVTEKVDMIFYNLPMSINQEDATSAKNTALYVSPAPAVTTKICKPLGRLSWLSKGNIFIEADIYCEPGCQYFIFMKDNKPSFANAMSESGIVFFDQIINQAAQQRPQ